MTPLLQAALSTLGAVIAAVTGAYVATRRLKADIRKTNAEASETEQSASEKEASAAVKLIDAARELIEPYQEQVAVLRKELADARRDLSAVHQLNREVTARVRVLEQHVLRLENELTRVGVNPPAPPANGGHL